MDADVEPEPCRDCMTPIPPGWEWCADCERKRKDRGVVDLMARLEESLRAERPIRGGRLDHRPFKSEG
jgi:hypothetical protein